MVKLGDEYISEIGLFVSKKESPIRVELGTLEDNEFQSSGNTLTEMYSESRVYRNIPSEIGEYQYAGKVELDFFDTTIVRYFSTVYDVVK